MNKNQFLVELNKELQPLNNAERNEIIDFYKERITKGTLYEGKMEEEVILELESPKLIAQNIFAEYGINEEKIEKQTKDKSTNIMGIIGVICLDIFVFSLLGFISGFIWGHMIFFFFF